MTKTCRRCGETKSLDGFHNMPGGKYGKGTLCRVCHALANRAWQLKNPERVRELAREQYRRGREIRERSCESCGARIPHERHGRARFCSRRCSDAADETLQVRRKCRQRTRAAVKRGDLVKQPCAVCGSPTVEAHHEDYSDPLNVQWLCFEHHRTLMHGQSISKEEALCR